MEASQPWWWLSAARVAGKAQSGALVRAYRCQFDASPGVEFANIFGFEFPADNVLKDYKVCLARVHKQAGRIHFKVSRPACGISARWAADLRGSTCRQDEGQRSNR
jgi:hypothetical protein